MPAMGDFLDFLLGGGTPSSAIANTLKNMKPNYEDQLKCIGDANAATAALDAKWYDIAQNWNPTGNFKPSDMSAMLNATFKLLSDAQVAVMFAPHTTADAGEQISQALGDLNTKMKEAAPYQEGVTNAQASGADVINAPGFKDWVTSAMVVASGAYAVRAVMECNVSWLQKVSDAIDAVKAIVMRVVDVAITGAETVLDVVDDAFSAYKYIKWIALGGAALWLVLELKKKS